jgi:hypothetical protein
MEWGDFNRIVFLSFNFTAKAKLECLSALKVNTSVIHVESRMKTIKFTWKHSWWKKGIMITTWSWWRKHASTPITLCAPLRRENKKQKNKTTMKKQWTPCTRNTRTQLCASSPVHWRYDSGDLLEWCVSEQKGVWMNTASLLWQQKHCWTSLWIKLSNG